MHWTLARTLRWLNQETRLVWMLSRMPSEASGPTGLHTSAEKSRMIMKHISWLKYSCPATKQTLKRWEKIVLQGRLNRGGLKIKVKLAENNWSQAHIRNASAKVFCLHFNNEVNQLTTKMLWCQKQNSYFYSSCLCSRFLWLSLLNQSSCASLCLNVPTSVCANFRAVWL